MEAIRAAGPRLDLLGIALRSGTVKEKAIATLKG